MVNFENIFIVLPAYNAAKTLHLTLNEIPEPFKKNIILVDDGSSDDTVKLAKERGLIVFQHDRNLGYGANQKTCYSKALAMGADIIVMLHPDHQYDGRLIPALVNPILSENINAVFGSRMLGGKPLEGGMPKWKYIANVFLTAVANIVFGHYLTEIHSGFRAYTRHYLEAVRYKENSNDFVFDCEIIAQGMACNLDFQEIPIETRYFNEASSINFTKSVIYGFGVLYVLFRYWLNDTNLLAWGKLKPI